MKFSKRCPYGRRNHVGAAWSAYRRVAYEQAHGAQICPLSALTWLHGAQICFAPASMSIYYARPDIVWRPIVDIEPLQIALAWRTDETNPLVKIFVSLVHAVAVELQASR